MQFITISYLFLTAFCLLLILKGLKYGLTKSEIEISKQNKVFVFATSGLVIWLATISGLASTGFFSDFSSLPPKITLVLVPPMLIWLIVTIRSKTLKQILMQVPPQWIMYLQSFRVLVELLLWQQFLQGFTPIQMTFEGRNFDVFAGLSASVVGYIYAKNPIKYRRLAIIWNFAGLGLLLNILIVAILSFPTKFRYFMNEPANTFVADFPGVLLPGFLVMIAYTMHYFSLKQLLSKRD